jgi:hypothetical protein
MTEFYYMNKQAAAEGLRSSAEISMDPDQIHLQIFQHTGVHHPHPRIRFEEFQR